MLMVLHSGMPSIPKCSTPKREQDTVTKISGHSTYLDCIVSPSVPATLVPAEELCLVDDVTELAALTFRWVVEQLLLFPTEAVAVVELPEACFCCCLYRDMLKKRPRMAFKLPSRISKQNRQVDRSHHHNSGLVTAT